MSFLRPRVPLLNPVKEIWVKVASGLYVKGMFCIKIDGIYQQKSPPIKINGLYR